MERDGLHANAAVVAHSGFFLVYSMAAEAGKVLAKAIIRGGAYTQSGKAKRDIFVKPPSCIRDGTDI